MLSPNNEVQLYSSLTFLHCALHIIVAQLYSVQIAQLNSVQIVQLHSVQIAQLHSVQTQLYSCSDSSCSVLPPPPQLTLNVCSPQTIWAEHTKLCEKISNADPG